MEIVLDIPYLSNYDIMKNYYAIIMKNCGLKQVNSDVGFSESKSEKQLGERDAHCTSKYIN